MIVAFVHLLAQSACKSAEEDGGRGRRDIVLSMLVVGLVFLAVIALGELDDWRTPQAPHR